MVQVVCTNYHIYVLYHFPEWSDWYLSGTKYLFGLVQNIQTAGTDFVPSFGIMLYIVFVRV